MANNSAFVPSIYDAVNKLRIVENIKVKNADPSVPTIRNQTVLNVPSENIGLQRVLQKRMRGRLDKMHDTMVNDISKFVNHQMKDADWIASPVAFDMLTACIVEEFIEKILPEDGVVTAAPLGTSVLSFLKLCIYLVSLDELGEVDKSMYRKAKTWYKDAKPLMEEMKLGIRAYTKLDPDAHPTDLKVKDRDKLEESLKIVRDIIMKRQAGKANPREGIIKSKDGWTSKINSLFTSVMTYFSSGTEASYNAIVKNVSVLGDPSLNVLFHEEGADEDSLNDALDKRKHMQQIVKKHGGQGLALSPAHLAKLVDSNPEAHKEYTRARTALNNSTKTSIKALVRKEGNALILADKVKAYLVKNGLSTAAIPAGFTGKDFSYDEDMNQFFKGVRLGGFVNGGWVKGNPMYNPETDDTWLVRGQGASDKTEKTIRSYAWVTEGREGKKKAATSANKENMSGIMAAWRKDLNSPHENVRELAHIVETLYKTAARIGSEKGNTDGEQTFGISSLQVQHVKAGPNGSLIFDYPGKKGMQQLLTLKPKDEFDKKIIAFIKDMKKGKSPTDWLFTTGKSNKRISENAVRAYLKEMGLAGGPHKFRHHRGDELFNTYISKNPAPRSPNQKQMTDYWRDATTYVGNQLGHQRTKKDGTTEPVGSTAAQSYINKDLQRELFKKAKVRVPSMIA